MWDRAVPHPIYSSIVRWHAHHARDFSVRWHAHPARDFSVRWQAHPARDFSVSGTHILRVISRAGRLCHFFKTETVSLFLLAHTSDSAHAFVHHGRIAGISNAANARDRNVQLLTRVNIHVGGARNRDFGPLGMQLFGFDVARTTTTDIDKLCLARCLYVGRTVVAQAKLVVLHVRN